jgi:hypothetical protein
MRFPNGHQSALCERKANISTKNAVDASAKLVFVVANSAMQGETWLTKMINAICKAMEFA